jgi:hypothetical protein
MLLVYSLNVAQNIGIGSLQTLELLLSSGIVLAAFFSIEYRSKTPLMPLGFLRSSIFEANAVGLLQVAASVGMIFILTNYFQQMLGYPALSAGLAFVPIGVQFLVVSNFLSARSVNRFGVKPNNRLTVAFADLRKLLWTAGTNAFHSVWIWVRFHSS